MARRRQARPVTCPAGQGTLVRVLLVAGLLLGLVLMHTFGHPGGHHTGGVVGVSAVASDHPAGHLPDAPGTDPGCDTVMICTAVLTPAGFSGLELLPAAVAVSTGRPVCPVGSVVRTVVAVPTWCAPRLASLSILRV